MIDSLTFLVSKVLGFFPFVSIGFRSYVFLGLPHYTCVRVCLQISCLLHWTLSPSIAVTSQSCSTCKGPDKKAGTHVQ